MEQSVPPGESPPSFLEVFPPGESHRVPECDTGVTHLHFAAAGEVLGDPEVEAGLMTANTFVHPLNTFIVSAGESFSSHGKILLNMITNDVNLLMCSITYSCINFKISCMS